MLPLYMVVFCLPGLLSGKYSDCLYSQFFDSPRSSYPFWLENGETRRTFFCNRSKRMNANLSILVGQSSRVSHANIRTQRARFDSPFKNSKHHLSGLPRKMKALPYFLTQLTLGNSNPL